MPDETPDFGQLVEYVTAGPVIHAVPLSEHSLDAPATLEAVQADYAKVTGLGRQPALSSGDLEALRAIAGAVYHPDVIAHEIVSSDPAVVVGRLLWVRSHPAWSPGVAVAVDEVYFHAGALYQAVQAHTTQSDWPPDLTPNLWRSYYEPEAGPQPWVQPLGGHDAYALGARVTHDGAIWESAVANNVWEPGVFGWAQV